MKCIANIGSFQSVIIVYNIERTDGWIFRKRIKLKKKYQRTIHTIRYDVLFLKPVFLTETKADIKKHIKNTKGSLLHIKMFVKA